ncbi:hypothetical protein EG329_003389 [Mollisiaceae sp. DMI_Dod_QoI]|nr:hypothetical protein EG329_003389 [Helotiales sp. DMI_Dod_QoI]
MFAWYRKARRCYVYLSDVESISDLSQSRWFTRGWTLQELIAPTEVIFFNKYWLQIGTKNSAGHSLMNVISAITTIPPVVLTAEFEPGQLSLFSIAQIMSWAAERQTTREEDLAYCLIGLFGVNMPMIYGEGNKAFLRLQLEILKVTYDHSIFTWTRPRVENSSPFALAPSEFQQCGNVSRSAAGNHAESEYAMTNRGLRIKLVLMSARSIDPSEYYAALNCTEDGIERGIYIMRINNTDQYTRSRCFELGRRDEHFCDKPETEEIYITSPPAKLNTSYEIRNSLFRLPPPIHQFRVAFFGDQWDIIEKIATPRGIWIPRCSHPGAHQWQLSLDGYNQDAGLMLQNTHTANRFAVILGVGGSANRSIWAGIETSIDDLERTKNCRSQQKSDFIGCDEELVVNKALSRHLIARVQVSQILTPIKFEFKVLISVLPQWDPQFLDRGEIAVDVYRQMALTPFERWM